MCSLFFAITTTGS